MGGEGLGQSRLVGEGEEVSMSNLSVLVQSKKRCQW